MTFRHFPTVAIAAAVAFLGTVGCASSDVGAASGRITGRLRADRIPPDATAEVDLDEGDGPATPVVGVAVRVDDLGRFTTGSLRPGRYLVVVRTREAPPSTASAVIPGRADVDIRLGTPASGTTVTLESPATVTGVRTLRLVPAAPRGPVPDRREVVLLPGQQSRVAGLAPGLWHVDVMPDGATADFEVPAGEGVPRFVIDPPDFPGVGVALEGTVVRKGGGPAFGAAVTVRATLADGTTVEPWGRVALVDRNGRFRVDRLAPGTAYVRVESRDAAFRILPAPQLIGISPPAETGRAFTVEP